MFGGGLWWAVVVGADVGGCCGDLVVVGFDLGWCWWFGLVGCGVSPKQC